MKVKIECGKLLETLKRAKPFVGDKMIDDRLKFVELSATKKHLEVRAYDSIAFFRAKVEADVSEPGSAAVDFGMLLALASSFSPEDMMLMSSAEKFLTAKVGTKGERNESRIAMISEWFDCPKAVKPDVAEMKAESFKDVVKRTLVAVSADAFQPLFQGMNFHFKGVTMTVTATNYKMIVQGTFRGKKFKGLDLSMTVGGRQLDAICKAAGSDDTIKVGKATTGKSEQAYFRTDSMQVLVALLPEKGEDTFLNLMAKAKAKVEGGGKKIQNFALNRGRLSSMLSALRIVEEKSKLVEFSGDGDKLTLSSEQDARGAIKHTFKVDAKLSKFEFLANGETLQQLVDAVFHSEEEVAFGFRDSTLALEVTSDNNKNWLCLFPPLVKY